MKIRLTCKLFNDIICEYGELVVKVKNKNHLEKICKSNFKLSIDYSLLQQLELNYNKIKEVYLNEQHNLTNLLHITNLQKLEILRRWIL